MKTNNKFWKSQISSLICATKNLFFRGNNLLMALIVAKFKHNQIVIGRNVVLRHCRFLLYGSGNHIMIGDNCNLSGVRVYMNSGGASLLIGEKVKVNATKKRMTLFALCNGSKIVIGEHCLFSNNIECHTTDYHKVLFNDKQINSPMNITFGKHCWIGLQCLILKGTELADNTIVGARSLVNKQFDESNIVIAGNPAKVIKSGVTWDF